MAVRHRASLGRKLPEEQFALVDPDLFVEFLRWLEAPPQDGRNLEPGLLPLPRR